MNPPQTLSLEEIQKILPHRYPFLLVDRITSLEKGKRVVGLKNVTINEPFFQGHFPGRPIMPGVLIAEAMAQVGGILALLSTPGKPGQLLPLPAGHGQDALPPAGGPGRSIAHRSGIRARRQEILENEGPGLCQPDPGGRRGAHGRGGSRGGMSMAQIHPTALVDKTVELGEGVTVGPLQHHPGPGADRPRHPHRLPRGD